MSPFRCFLLAALFLTIPSHGTTNAPGCTSTDGGPGNTDEVDDSVPDPICYKCDVVVPCPPETQSFEWNVAIGLARYAKPTGFTEIGQAAYELNGNLPDFKQLYGRYFSHEPLQQQQIFLNISQPQLSAASFHPSCLFLQSEADITTLKKPAENGFPEYIHQIVTDDRFTLIEPLPGTNSGWQLRVWKTDAATLTLSSGYYLTSGFEAITPLTEVTFTRPAGATDYNTLLYTQKETTGLSGTRTITTEISQSLDSNGKPTTVVSKSYSGEGTGGPLLSQQNINYSARGAKAWDYTIQREVYTASANAAGTIGGLVLTSKTLEDYDDYSIGSNGGELGMKRLVTRTDAYNVTGQTAQTASYTYMSAPTEPTLHGRLLTAEKPDGSWISYDYSVSVAGVPVVMKYSGWKDIGMADKTSARLTETIIDGNTTNVVTTIGTQVVAKSKTTLSINPDSGDVFTSTENWDGTTWHATTTAYHSDNAAPPSTGRIKWVEHPDGTATTFSYSINQHGNLVQISRTGAGSRNGITTGTQITTTYTTGNIPIEQESKDIASELIIEHWVADSTAGFDATGRPVKRIYNADVNDFDITQYACCGLDEARARDGSMTKYYRDAIKRVYKTEFRASVNSPVITTFTTYDGLTTKRTRSVGSSDSLFIGSTSRSLDELTTITIEPSRKFNAEDPEFDTVADRVTTTTVTARSTTGDIVTTTHADNSTTITAHYLDGQIKSVSGSAVTKGDGPAVINDYGTFSEGSGGLTSTVTASGVSTVTFADLLGRTTKIVSPATGNSGYDYHFAPGKTAYAYHPTNAAAGSRGKLQSVTDGDGVTVTYGYNGEGERNTTSRTIPTSGNATATQVTTVLNDVTDGISIHGQSIGVSLRQTQTISSTDVASITVSESYRSIDGLKSATRSLGRDTVAVTTRPSSSGVATRTTIHPDGIKTVETLTHGLTTRVEKRDTADTVISATDYGYDAQQRLETVTDLRSGTAGKTTYSDFTESGQPLTITQGTTTPNIRVTHLTKDILGRTTVTTLPDETVSYTSYCPTGQVRAQWGSQTNPVFHVYDEQNRLIELHTWQTAPTLPLTTDAPPAGSAVTIWQYSTTTGRLDRKQYADGNGTNYTYTNAGRLLTRVWARGITTAYGYTHGLLTSTDYSDSTPDVAITYDSLGRQSIVTQANQSRIETTYDPATLQADQEIVSYDLDHNGTWDFTRTLDRKPTNLGRDTGWQLKNGGTIENEALYTWSATHGRLSQISNPQISNLQFTYDYVPNSNLIATITGPAHTVTNTWEPTRDVLDIKENKVAGISVSSYDYVVNAIGQRTNVEQGGSAFSSSRDIGWAYDSLGQVTSADSSIPAHRRAYQYDTIGNRLFSEISNTQISNPPTANTTAYTANAINQYTAVNTFAPTHDDDGNQIDAQILPPGSSSLESCVFTWDAENRLVEIRSADDNAIIASYLYDAQSRRIAKKVGTATTLYVYDLFNCIAEYSWSADLQSASLSKTRTWGIDLSGTQQGAGGVGGLLAETQGNSTFYPTYDGNGNVSEYLAADGTVSAHFEYDPFGNTVVNTDSSGQFSYRFSTKPLDSETGLYYYLYRYYDPITGRWLNRDPIEEQAGVNLYRFVGNEAVRFIDFLGLYDYQPIYDQIVAGGQDAAARTREDLESRQRAYDNLTREQQVEETRPTEGREFAGRVCRKCVDGKYTYYTTIKENLVAGSSSSSRPYLAPPCDGDDITVATFHSHPNLSDGTPVPYLSGDGKLKGSADTGGDRDFARAGGGVDPTKVIPPNTLIGATTQDGTQTQIFNPLIGLTGETIDIPPKTNN